MRTFVRIGVVVAACAGIALIAGLGGERQASARAPLTGPPPTTVSAINASARCASARTRAVRLDRQVAATRVLANKGKTSTARRAAKKRLGRLIAARRQATIARTSACRSPRPLPLPTIAAPVGPTPGSPAPPSAVGVVTTPGTTTPPTTPAVPEPPAPPDPTPPGPDPIPPVPAPGERASADRPDVRSGPLFHVIYVVPSDGIDRRRDTDGQIARSVIAGQDFLEQAGGFRLKLDTYGGQPDISFIRMAMTDAQAAQQGAYVRSVIEDEVHAAGFNDPDKLYLVYYEGVNTTACGSAPWPVGASSVAALYLHGEPDGFPCDSLDLVDEGQPAGYWEHGLVHEAVHLQGMVPSCAPNAAYSTPGHVGDFANDLMYAGPLAWAPDLVDVGNDDYYNADIPGCPDLSDSQWIER